jgi:hypothetical protein
MEQKRYYGEIQDVLANHSRATLEPLREATRGTMKALESLKGSVSPLVESMSELTQGIETAKQEFSSI